MESGGKFNSRYALHAKYAKGPKIMKDWRVGDEAVRITSGDMRSCSIRMRVVRQQVFAKLEAPFVVGQRLFGMAGLSAACRKVPHPVQAHGHVPLRSGSIRLHPEEVLHRGVGGLEVADGGGERGVREGVVTLDYEKLKMCIQHVRPVRLQSENVNEEVAVSPAGFPVGFLEGTAFDLITDRVWMREVARKVQVVKWRVAATDIAGEEETGLLSPRSGVKELELSVGDAAKVGIIRGGALRRRRARQSG
jgi:hypothetical protein